MHTDNKTVCSFCGRSQDEVGRLIAGQTGFICNDCVELCKELIEHYKTEDIESFDDAKKEITLLKPKERHFILHSLKMVSRQKSIPILMAAFL